MITKEQLDQILHFVSKRWVDMSRNPDHDAFKNLPSNFWMNSIGGPAGKGRWITMLMYTDDEAGPRGEHGPPGPHNNANVYR